MTTVQELQAPLKARYRRDPPSARVIDRASSAPHAVDDPFHVSVMAQGAGHAIAIATHRGHGGPHDAATPGDLLCAALGACYELTLRMVANVMDLQIDELKVRVEGDVDLRGSLGMGGAPAGFQAMRLQTTIALRNGGPKEVERLERAAQACCVVGQTLQAGVIIDYGSGGQDGKVEHGRPLGREGS